MTKLIRYLKPYVWWIVAIFVLLFGQAMADLSLPTYMAAIVNVGIQQNGIQDAVPQVVRASEFSRLTLFMNESDKTEVSADYTLLDKAVLSPDVYNSQVKKYPLLANSPLYVLNAVNSTQIARLDQIFTRCMPIVAGIEQNGLGVLPGGELQIPAGVDPFTFIAQLSPVQLAIIQNLISSQTSALPATVLAQYSIAYITAEYKTIGVDLGSLRASFMWHIGLIMLGLTLASAMAAVVVGLMSARIAAGLGRDLRRRQFERVERFSKQSSISSPQLR